MISLLNLTEQELARFITEDLGEPAFRARQLWQWLWAKRADSFDQMTNLSKQARDRLKEVALIRYPEIETIQESADGTVKFLLRLSDGQTVETVLIPSESRDGKKRITQCLSCQVGCEMGCTFCSTGSMGFIRNMTMEEILGQVLIAQNYLDDDKTDPKIRNLVFMGMGEPLLNFDELMRSLRTLHSETGLSFSARRITVSTSGPKEGEEALRELGESGLAYLAVSLHAPNQEIRKAIMPRAARWPLGDMVRALEGYPLKNRERMTFEYLMLGGVNDSQEHARELAALMSRIKGKVNLILYNAAKGAPYKTPTPEAVLAFEKILWAKGLTAVVRKSKGADIDAACGQLRAKAEQGL